MVTVNKIVKAIENDIHLKELIKGSVIFLILRVLGLIAIYGFTLLVTRKLGASAWGVFTLCLTILQITSIVGRLGLDMALLKLVAQHRTAGEISILKSLYIKSASTAAIFCFFLSLVLYVCAPNIAKEIFEKQYLTSYIKLIAVAIMPYVLLHISAESLRGLKQMGKYTFYNSFLYPSLSVIMLIIVSLWFGEVKLDWIFVIFMASIIISAVFSIFDILKALDELSKAKKTYPIKKFIYMLQHISIPMFLSNSIFFAIMWTDILLLGVIKSEEDVGIYNVSFRLASIISFSLLILNSISAPKFAEFWGNNDLLGLQTYAKRISKISFWLSFPVVLMFLFLGKHIMTLFGEKFIDGFLPLLILAFGNLINVMCGSVGYILNMTGEQKFVRNVFIVAFLSNLALNWVLIHYFGMIGAALASTLVLIFWNIVFSFKVESKLGAYIFYVPWK